MPKKPCDRTFLGSQHVKSTKTLLKSERQYFCRVFRSVWNKMSLKKSLSVVSETLRLFVNILTPDDKYTLSVKASVSGNQFKSNCLEIEKCFLDFFPQCRNLYKILNTLDKKNSLRGYLYLRLETAKSRIT